MGGSLLQPVSIISSPWLDVKGGLGRLACEGPLELATEETEGVSVHGWRADMRQCGRSGEHYAADILGVMIHQVLGPKARLGNVVRDNRK